MRIGWVGWAVLAGVALDGTVVAADKQANRAVYQKDLSPPDILNGQGVAVPNGAAGFAQALARYSY